jgi:hypothetical protein
MDFWSSLEMTVEEVCLTIANKDAYRSEELRNPIKFIFRMKIAVHFCMGAHHHRRGEWKETKGDRR